MSKNNCTLKLECRLLDGNCVSQNFEGIVPLFLASSIAYEKPLIILIPDTLYVFFLNIFKNFILDAME